MRFSEWLDKKVDIAAAVYDANPTTERQVQVNQDALSSVIVGMKILDTRLERIETHLGLDPIDI